MNNTYGIVKPSVINPTTDVEIWYKYTPNRSNTEEEYNKFKKISSTDVQTMLTACEMSDDVEAQERAIDKKLPGLYNLSLPASIFGRHGYYTLYIIPRQIQCTIGYVGALAAYPEIRGIVVNLEEIDSENRSLFQNDNLTGYRIEYFDATTESNILERQDYYRLITSCGLCEPVSQNLTSANTNTTGYRYNDSGSLAFLTVSPSVAPNFKGSQKPYIGMPNQKIVITNTKFDPVMIEIEMCRNDFDTITTVLTGNQIRSLDNGIVTTYNNNGEIHLQQEFFTVKDTYTHSDVYEVKRNREGSIDSSADYNEIINT